MINLEAYQIVPFTQKIFEWSSSSKFENTDPINVFRNLDKTKLPPEIKTRDWNTITNALGFIAIVLLVPGVKAEDWHTIPKTMKAAVRIAFIAGVLLFAAPIGTLYHGTAAILKYAFKQTSNEESSKIQAHVDACFKDFCAFIKAAATIGISAIVLTSSYSKWSTSTTLIEQIFWAALIPLNLGITTEIFSRYLPKNEMHPTTLISPEEIERLNFTSEIHEICEMDIEGNHKACSLERMTDILNSFKEKGEQRIINSVPKYLIAHGYSKYRGDIPKPLYTPLQHFAAKGNLAAVKLLMLHGAIDYCHPYEGLIYQTESALYAAALNGHVQIVDYLLSQGVHASIAFKDNALRSFIPRFVFEISRNKKSIDRNIHCLRKILTHLKSYFPTSLKIQLSIPLDKPLNSAGYIASQLKNDKNYMKSEMGRDFLKLTELLKEFGSDEKVLPVDVLRNTGFDIGTGWTLSEMVRWKENK